MILKRSILISLVICLGINASVKSQKITDPQEIGLTVFSILNEIDQLSAEKYAKKMMSIRSFHGLVEEYSITDEQQAQAIRNMPKKRWQELAFNDYQGLEQFSKENEITWQNIRFQAYEYAEVEKGGVVYYDGLLTFEHLVDAYQLSITSIKTGNSVEIVRIHVPLDRF